jgi:hypothetical protein
MAETPVLEQEHFFKLPLAVQQTVIAFSSFNVIQEIYTMLSPKYKKLFWSCLPKEIQAMPETKLVKLVSAIKKIEISEGWKTLSQDVHIYVLRNPGLIESFHPDIKFYFRGGHNDEQVS